jgi:hypothetical protein
LLRVRRQVLPPSSSSSSPSPPPPLPPAAAAAAAAAAAGAAATSPTAPAVPARAGAVRRGLSSTFDDRRTREKEPLHATRPRLSPGLSCPPCSLTNTMGLTLVTQACKGGVTHIMPSKYHDEMISLVFIHTKYREPIVIMVFRRAIQKALCLTPPGLHGLRSLRGSLTNTMGPWELSVKSNPNRKVFPYGQVLHDAHHSHSVYHIDEVRTARAARSRTTRSAAASSRGPSSRRKATRRRYPSPFSRPFF